MYASLLNLNLGPGMRSTGEQLADQSNPTLKTRKGFGLPPQRIPLPMLELKIV